jgi:hypothetical protein
LRILLIFIEEINFRIMYSFMNSILKMKNIGKKIRLGPVKLKVIRRKGINMSLINKLSSNSLTKAFSNRD